MTRKAVPKDEGLWAAGNGTFPDPRSLVSFHVLCQVSFFRKADATLGTFMVLDTEMYGLDVLLPVTL